MRRTLMALVATAAFIAMTALPAAAATGRILAGSSGEYWASGQAHSLTAEYADVAPDSELFLFFDDPGNAVTVSVDAATLPAECESHDGMSVLCTVSGTGSVTYIVTPTLSDAEAECPINPSTTFPDPCFVAGGEILEPGASFPTNLLGLIQKVRPADDDTDYIDDTIDTDSAAFSNDFTDGTTFGTITARNSMVPYVNDLASDGVEVIIRPINGSDVVMTLCGETGSTAFSSGARASVTCGSVTITATEGTVVRDLGGGVTLTIPAGSTVTTTDSGTVIVEEGSAELETPDGTTTIDPEDGEVPISPDGDSDGDGIPDANDPDELWDELSAIGDGSWSSNGKPRAVRSVLDDVQAEILAGNLDEAHALLDVLLKRSDGSGNDWLSAPAAAEFHAAVMAFKAALS